MFTTKGGMDIEVVSDRGEVLFCVADTAPGISTADLMDIRLQQRRQRE